MVVPFLVYLPLLLYQTLIMVARSHQVNLTLHQAHAWPDFAPDLICPPNPCRNRTTEFPLWDCDGIGPAVFKIVARELGLDFVLSPNTETVVDNNGNVVETGLIQIYKGEKYLSVSLYGINQARLDYVDFLDFVRINMVFLTRAPRQIFSESLGWPLERIASGIFLLNCVLFPVVLLVIRHAFGMPKDLKLLAVRIFLSQPGRHKEATK